jgi:hypothetical protein
MGRVITMGEITKKENDWQDKATAAAIAGARKIVLGNGPLMNTPVGRLSDAQWGWIITAVIFGWTQTRVEQAIEEGLNQEEAVRLTGLNPSPCDVAVVASILPTLADKAAIDWSQPLQAWSKDTMTNFLFLAWQLITKAELARDNGPGKILRPSADLSIPEFLRRTQEPQKTWDEKKGDDIPFDLQPNSS